MAKFINNKTGNPLNVKDEGTIALMRKSDRYTEVKAKKSNSKSGKDQDTENEPAAEE